MTTTMAPATPTVGGRHGWRIVATIAITSTVGYGTLYYAYAVLLSPMAASLDASTTAVTVASWIRAARTPRRSASSTSARTRWTARCASASERARA